MADTVTTPMFRASYCKLFDPKPNSKGKSVYEITMIFDEGTDLENLKRSYRQAVEEKWGAAKPPRFTFKAFRKGADEEFDLDKYPEYAGKIIVTARSHGMPVGVVDKNRQSIIDPAEVYSGMWARAKVQAYIITPKPGPADQGGHNTTGVAFSLHHVQKIKDDEPLGMSRGKAEDAFDEWVEPSGAGNHDDMLGDLDGV